MALSDLVLVALLTAVFVILFFIAAAFEVSMFIKYGTGKEENENKNDKGNGID